MVNSGFNESYIYFYKPGLKSPFSRTFPSFRKKYHNVLLKGGFLEREHLFTVIYW